MGQKHVDLETTKTTQLTPHTYLIVEYVINYTKKILLKILVLVNSFIKIIDRRKGLIYVEKNMLYLTN